MVQCSAAERRWPAPMAVVVRWLAAILGAVLRSYYTCFVAQCRPKAAVQPRSQVCLPRHRSAEASESVPTRSLTHYKADDRFLTHQRIEALAYNQKWHTTTGCGCPCADAIEPRQALQSTLATSLPYCARVFTAARLVRDKNDKSARGAAHAADAPRTALDVPHTP